MSIVDKWIQDIKAKSKKEEQKKLLPAAFPFLEKNYVGGIKDYNQANPARPFLGQDEVDCRIEFVRNWLKTANQIHLEPKERELDDEQLRAVGTVGKDLLVTARAGSGKTRTLVTRAIFLIEKCGIQPDEILLTVFNRKAKYEILNRLAKAIGTQKLPHVFNFHSLAYWISRPKGELFSKEDEADKKEFLKTIVIPGVFTARPELKKDWELLLDEHFTRTIEKDGEVGRKASNLVDAESRFIEALNTFINLKRKFHKNLNSTAENKQADLVIDKEQRFFRLASVVDDAYMKNLASHNKADFDGLILKAIEVIGKGGNHFPYNITPETKGGKSLGKDLVISPNRLKHIMVDEYQDFSSLFFSLVDAIRKRSPNCETFCVGDDWQAINGFAGSDLEYFRAHGHYFQREPETQNIRTNYRSGKSVVAYGNAIMKGNGVEAESRKGAESGKAFLVNLDSFLPGNLLEAHEYGIDISLPAAVRILGKLKQEPSQTGPEDRGVAMLCRLEKHPQLKGAKYNNYLKRLNHHLGLEYMEQWVHRDKVHQYKGKQKEHVLILDAFDSNYPHKHPDWIFTKYFGNTELKIREEEQRLFYVAATRAIRNLFVFSSADPTGFLAEGHLEAINWNDFPPLEGQTGEYLLVVGNQEGAGTDPTKNIKSLLWQAGFYFQGRSFDIRLRNRWSRTEPKVGFDLEKILNSEAWAREGNGVEITVYGQADSVVQYKKLG